MSIENLSDLVRRLIIAHVPDFLVPCYCTMQKAAIELDSELTPKATEICIFLQVNARTPPVL
jgi:hypothetical protein